MNSPDFIGKKKQIQAARKAFDDSELRQFDLATTIQGIQDEAFKIPDSFFDIFNWEIPDIASSGPGPQTAALKGYTFMQKEAADASEILGQQTASLVPQIENLSSAFGDQMGSLRSLVPVMKQASAGMEGMVSDFASRTGPALEKLFGGLLSGKGGGIKDLLGSLKDSAIKTLARSGSNLVSRGLGDLFGGKGLGGVITGISPGNGPGGLGGGLGGIFENLTGIFGSPGGGGLLGSMSDMFGPGGSMLGGLKNVFGSAGGSGGMLGGLSKLFGKSGGGGLLGGLSSLFGKSGGGGLLGGLSGIFGGLGSSLSGLFGGGGQGGGGGLSGIFSSFVGGGGSLGGRQKSSLGGTIGTIAGSAFGPLGGGIGNMIGSAVGKIFKFAGGGLVTGPTLGLLGEAGPELIVPLKKLRNSSSFQSTLRLAASISPSKNFDPLGPPGEADRMYAARAAREEAADRRERRVRREDIREVAREVGREIVTGLKTAGFGQTINYNIDNRGSFNPDPRSLEKLYDRLDDHGRGRRRYGRGRG